MTAPLSLDLRARLVKAVEAGASARAVALRFDVSPSTVVKLMQRVRRTGSAAPARIGGYRKPLLAGYEDLIVELTRTHRGITLAELQVAIVERGGPRAHLSTIWHTLRRLGLKHKKRA